MMSVGTRSLGFAKIYPNVRKSFRATVISQLLRTLQLIGSEIPHIKVIADCKWTFASVVPGSLLWIPRGNVQDGQPSEEAIDLKLRKDFLES